MDNPGHQSHTGWGRVAKYPEQVQMWDGFPESFGGYQT